ncbi:unnamed protein product [Plutella xylostella]|uniref:(diamondback moth) hypothetical protein n=1 Tax=Plutella xylostella TaxID=51655 RepID=A0A8S4FW33_PLUXY|nr:unnamed protein product [Plutella xylostella]
MMLLQASYGHERVWSVAIFTLALTINGAVTAGYLGNGLDIAPNFSASYGHERVWSVAIFTLALTINGAVTAGYLGNGLDIAPNFSGTIFGMANTLSSFGGWLSTFMVGELTKEHNTYERWQIVFYILAATYALGAVCFVTLGSGELQPWSAPRDQPKDEKEEEPLNEKA